MKDLVSRSRIARAISELAIHSRSQMPFCVTEGYGVDPEIADGVARALGYQVVRTSLQVDPLLGGAAVGRILSNHMADSTGPTLIILSAREYDDGSTHRDIVERVSTIAADAWSCNGATFLMVFSPEDPAPIAQYIGTKLVRQDWAKAISF